MGFINLGRLNIRKRNSCASARVSFSDVQPPEVYKSHTSNGPINKLYVLEEYVSLDSLFITFPILSRLQDLLYDHRTRAFKNIR